MEYKTVKDWMRDTTYIPKSYQPKTLLDILNPPQEFYLTGSRFFGGADRNSDWDYFTEYNDEIISWLKSHGFVTYSATGYSDTNTVVVYRFWGEIQIDVQLVKNVVAKLRVQKCLFQSGLLRPGNKYDARALWDLCFNVIGIKQ